MKLLKLTLSNVKGVKSFTLEPNGHNATVYGANGTGKSTIAAALLWLLFDKGQDFKSAKVKTLDTAGVELHGLDHLAEGSFLLADGQTITLKKILSETWTKKRRTVDKVFSGNQSSYWVDGVPAKLKDYKAQVAALVSDEEVFKLLSSPFYFASILPWEKRRQTLLTICGDVSDQDVIDSDSDLVGLPDILGSYSIDSFKKIISEKLKLLDKKIQEIPVRIDEASLLLPDLTGLDLTVLKKHRAAIDKEIKTLTEQLRGLKEDGGAQAIKDKVSRLEFELEQIRGREEQARREEVLHLRQELNTNEHQQTMQDSRFQAGQNANNIVIKNKKRMAALRHDYARISEKKFILDSAECCLTCGQTLTEDTQESAFNAWKSQNLEKIQTGGKNLKDDNEKLSLVINIGEDAKKDIEQLKKENLEVGAKIDAASNIEHPPGEEYLAAEGKIAELEACLKDIESGTTDTSALRDKITEEKAELQKEVEELKEQIDKFTTAKDIKARIKALGLEERSLAGKYEEIEGQKFLIESFIRTKVEMLEGPINEKLNYPGLSVKMLKNQVNGALAECCEILYLGVPFGSGFDLNHGARINVGITIINMLSDHYGIRLPLFVDNAEAVTDLQESESQVIRLVVSKPDKVLRVEIEG